MRKILLIAAVFALVPFVADAQQPTESTPAATPQLAAPPQTPAPVPAATTDEDEYVPPLKNVFDFGFRGTSIRGDSARYERYRDLGNGLFLEGFRLHRQTGNNWFLDLGGDHIGRLDQRYTGSLVLPGKVKAFVQWDQLPTLMSNSTRTLFTAVSPDVLVLDDALQTTVQTTASTLPSLAKAGATGFDLKSRRYIGEGRFEFIATPEFTFTQSFRHMNRTGSIPYGGSFGHGNFAETMAPVSHQSNDLNGTGEFAHGPVLFRAGYVASFFHNDFTSLTFDNPWRVVDIATASSRGRSSLAPSNSVFSVNGLASVKMPGHTRASAYFSTGILKDAAGTQILSQTINGAVTGLQPLSRTTVDGEGRTSAVNLTFSSRPVKYVDINARYRTYDYDNRTPEFSIFQRVSYDNAPALSATPITTEPFGIKRKNLDVDVRFIPRSALTAGIGFSSITEDRSLRMFEETTEHVTRLTVDSVGTRWINVRTKFEHSVKRGTLDAEAYSEMVAAGEQPGMRQFDIAPRDRDRATVLGSIMPTGNLSVTFSAATGHDDYLQSLFGVRDNKHYVYSAGFDAAPGDTVLFELLYTLENYKTLSRSRNSSPGVTFIDETRNWANDSTDRVHSVVASAEIQKIADKLDLKFSFDMSRARTTYTYITGPVAGFLLAGENASLTSTLPAPVQLPATLSQLGRATVDATYNLTSRIGIGVTYWYEQYRVSDFTLDEQANPNLSYANALLTGYIYRPYTANTVWGRMVYRF